MVWNCLATSNFKKTFPCEWLEEKLCKENKNFFRGIEITVDCLQSAFSLKIRLVLISASAIANHDVSSDGKW